jgi:GntR family transcriptional repressor for pyruvate dehydrogenase complex
MTVSEEQSLSVLRALDQKSVVDVVKEQILELFRAGRYRPADKLPSEKEFMNVLRVSRPSVRQALAGIAAHGIIESRPGLGYFVCEMPADSVFNVVLVPALLADETLRYLQEVRSIVEVEAIALAVDRATSEDLQALRANLAAMETEPDYAELGLRFHILIVASAHNPVLDSLYGVIADVIRSNLDELYQSNRTQEQELESHRLLIDAITSGDRRLARAAMVEHLTQVSEFLGIALAQRASTQP